MPLKQTQEYRANDLMQARDEGRVPGVRGCRHTWTALTAAAQGGGEAESAGSAAAAGRGGDLEEGHRAAAGQNVSDARVGAGLFVPACPCVMALPHVRAS